MSDQLFDIPACDSPRLAWMKRHFVQTRHDPSARHWTKPVWTCWRGNLLEAENYGEVTAGETEDEAITAWAKRNHVKLWNEEQTR